MRRGLGLAVVGGLASVVFIGLAIAAQQPHMDGALAALEQAKQEILIADQARDHGGHAGAATRLIDEAIHEVREGIRFRDAHGP
jgi:hypothetical protein